MVWGGSICCPGHKGMREWPSAPRQAYPHLLGPNKLLGSIILNPQVLSTFLNRLLAGEGQWMEGMKDRHAEDWGLEHWIQSEVCCGLTSDPGQQLISLGLTFLIWKMGYVTATQGSRNLERVGLPFQHWPSRYTWQMLNKSSLKQQIHQNSWHQVSPEFKKKKEREKKIKALKQSPCKFS